MASATLVCRRSWKRHDTPAAFCALEQWCVRKLDADSGLPAALANTKASGPACANDSRWAANSEAVNGEIVIERTPAAVLGSLRKNDRSSSWTSWSVTRIFRFFRSTLPRRSRTNSLQRMPVSTAT